MDADAIRSLLDRDPFLPLQLQTTEGGAYRVTPPGQVQFFGPSGRLNVVLNHGMQIPVAVVMAVELESVPEDFVSSGTESGSQMTIERFDEFLKRRPFVPFSVHVADGGSFEVKGPEFASRTQNGRTIFVSTGGDMTEWIDLLLVTLISSGVNNPSVSPKK